MYKSIQKYTPNMSRKAAVVCFRIVPIIAQRLAPIYRGLLLRLSLALLNSLQRQQVASQAAERKRRRDQKFLFMALPFSAAPEHYLLTYSSIYGIDVQIHSFVMCTRRQSYVYEWYKRMYCLVQLGIHYTCLQTRHAVK